MLLFALLMVQAWAAPVSWVRPGDPWRFEPLGNEPPDPGWFEPEFNDSAWLEGPSGFSLGYFSYQQAATVVPSFVGGTPTRGVLLRREFTVAELDSVAQLYLRAEYDDALRVWLNGREVVRRGYATDGEIAWDASGAVHPLGASELMDLTPFKGILNPGKNTLAVQVMDMSVPTGTLFAWLELRANFVRGPIVQCVLTNQATVTWEGPISNATWVELQGPDGKLRRFASTSIGPSHAVVLSDLEADTAYPYQVGWDDGAREILAAPAVFRTLRSAGDVDFLVVGDTGSGLAGQYHVESAMRRESPDLVLHTGDIVYPGFFNWRMDLRCLSVYEPMMARIPIFLTMGNHDVYGAIPDYLQAFWLPTNQVTGTEHFYSFDHGDVHFVCLFIPWYGFSNLGLLGPAGGEPSAQYRWLQRDLAESKRPWKVVFFHQAPRGSGPHVYDDYNVDGRLDQGQLLEALLPVFDENGVRVVFTGHDHFWERFAPTNGVHFMVTGGGGGVPYGVFRRDPSSTRVISQHHYLKVAVRGHEMHVSPLSTNGVILDEMVIRIAAPATNQIESAWHRPQAPPASAPREDGNVVGERFDFVGAGYCSVAGRSSNLGRLWINDELDRIHIGLRDVMLWPGQTVALFLASPRLGTGVSNLVGIGRDSGHPLGRLGLRFEGFTPQYVLLLGDEFADGLDPNFVRPPATFGLGQGAFRLDERLSPIASVGVRQFHESPQFSPDPQEQSADFIAVTIPRLELGAVLPEDVLDVAAVVVTPVTHLGEPQFILDTSFLGPSMVGDSGSGTSVLVPLRVKLAVPPNGDLDLDGLGPEEEEEASTDPRRPDTDGDGLPDGWEVQHHLSPVLAQGEDGRDGDPDGDGYTNEDEFRSGTNPREAASTLRISAAWSAGSLILAWRSMIGRRYDLEVSEDLATGFRPLGLPDFPRLARQTNESMILQAAPGGPERRWFRIRELR
ncbi:MAG: metallophosphoesterase [Verrucomicrobiales bacterium]|nr:metallophosphoesterase [Verrucomicrobiales bacterium]